MPHYDLSTEEQVLGALMRMAAGGRMEQLHTMIADIGAETCFNFPTSRAMYTSITTIATTGGAPSSERVAVDLQRRNVFAAINWPRGDRTYVTGLAESTTTRTVPELRMAIEQLRDLTKARRIEEACKETISDLSTRDVVPEEVAARLAAALWDAVDSGNGPSKGVDAAGAADAGQAHHDDLCRPEEDEWWLRTGLIDIDTLIGRRVRPGWLVVVGAQSKVGKSIFAANILRETGIRGERRPVYISIEMSIPELQQRIESSETGIPLDTLMDPLQMSDADTAKAAAYRVTQRRDASRFWIEEMPGATLPAVVSKIRLLTASRRARLVIIDYIQIMQLDDTRGQSRQSQIAKVSRTLKALAGELGIVIVVLSQLNADMFARARGGQAPRPAARDMRESKDLLNDANMVLLLDRPEEHDFESFHDGEECKGLARIEVAAARSGKTGWRTVRWNGECVRFDDLARALQPDIGSQMRPRESHYVYATDEPPF